MRAPGGSCGHLGALGGSFWLSCGAFWPHFDSLGTLFGLILALLGRLATSWDAFFAQVGPSWPKLAQDSEKKKRFLNLTCGSWLKLGAKNGGKSMPRTTFF